ncbi:MAG: substrate-binding domain-containing protein [Flavisolibacter sp.]|nr:substrate-binding domain-containing protein [Flavisolibacter sp.]
MFLQKYPELDGILFGTNYLAIAGLRAIAELKPQVASDIAVVGFDDNNHSNLFSPSITAVAQPIQEIAEEVLHQLMACLQNEAEGLKKRMVILPVKLIIRNSSVVKHKDTALI